MGVSVDRRQPGRDWRVRVTDRSPPSIGLVWWPFGLTQKENGPFTRKGLLFAATVSPEIDTATRYRAVEP
ncbi:hypothetical protein BRC91_11240 [Halobacteriales archaeon QS_4_62_28]|nr:MAG: hypothetical protein BRC91_11240 [Halobacteriales archaeon QS_4_62_28]